MSYVMREPMDGPKKMLSIDGGGLRGMISLQILARVEQLLRTHRNDPNLVLADEFDYIAGTSTGAIIAAGLALGKTVAELEALYVELAPTVFRKRRSLKVFWSLYGDRPLRDALQKAFGSTTTFGDARLRTLLLCVLHNATTDSPWPLSNCTTATFNNAGTADCNLNMKLWQVVRASTAAPVFFPPEKITLGTREFQFKDGGVTPYNNPAFIQYVMATTPEYGLNWEPGADNILSISVGTGMSTAATPKPQWWKGHLVGNARLALNYLMNSGVIEQDRLCRLFGECRYGSHLDHEVRDLRGTNRAHHAGFSYARYDADLSQGWLDTHGFSDMKSKTVSKLDSVKSLENFRRIGKAAADQVNIEHFSGFIN